jgi:hypothetical protein
MDMKRVMHGGRARWFMGAAGVVAKRAGRVGVELDALAEVTAHAALNPCTTAGWMDPAARSVILPIYWSKCG